VLAAHRAPDEVVLSLARGGVVVGYQVARALGVPLEILVCQRMMVQSCPSVAVGAVAEGGASYIDFGRAQAMEVAPEEIQHALRAVRLEVERRAQLYRGGRPLPELLGRKVILVDDGIASGATARVALAAVRELRPREVVVAVPVVARSVAEGLRRWADAVVYLYAPSVLHMPGEFYDDFTPLSDVDVVGWLERAQREHLGSSACA
jgi:putative phosphoribosyl transferase